MGLIYRDRVLISPDIILKEGRGAYILYPPGDPASRRLPQRARHVSPCKTAAALHHSRVADVLSFLLSEVQDAPGGGFVAPAA